MRAAQRLVNELVQFSKDAALAQSRVAQQGQLLSRALQHRLVRAGIFSSSSSSSSSSPVVSVVNVIATHQPLLSVQTQANIQILSSATMPMVVSFRHLSTTTNNNNNNTNNTTKMLIKSEDVRTDLLMLNCVKMMNHIVKQELQEDLNLLTYNVLPTGPSTGIVEFVQHASTIAEIETKYVLVVDACLLMLAC
tara:strand:- start:119 stop:697 length:579 start_codon:yes stop_codon:yes gene_type:complete